MAIIEKAEIPTNTSCTQTCPGQPSGTSVRTTLIHGDTAMERSPYQVLPDLLPEEYEALKASIAEHGVQVPIIVDHDGHTIDGFHRERVCDELGIDCPREVRHFESEADKLELALRLNCHRRMLNREQKRDLIAAYLRQDPQIADNYLADLIGGVSKNTVADVREELLATCQIDKFEKLRGKDGKDRPVKYKRIIANTAKDFAAQLNCLLSAQLNCHTTWKKKRASFFQVVV